MIVVERCPWRFLSTTHTKITLLIIKHLTILTLKFEQDHLGGTLQKHVFSHMWTAKVQISLRICTVWSGPSLCTYRIIGYYRMYEWRANAQGWIWICIFCAWCGPFNYLEVCLKMLRWGLHCLFGHVCSEIQGKSSRWTVLNLKVKLWRLWLHRLVCSLLFSYGIRKGF